MLTHPSHANRCTPCQGHGNMAKNILVGKSRYGADPEAHERLQRSIHRAAAEANPNPESVANRLKRDPVAEIMAVVERVEREIKNPPIPDFWGDIS